MEATIVLAEDDADLRALYAEWLRRAGHRVWEAADGGEAVAQVRACRPDLLLLDIWMPVLNGLEVLEYLKKSEGGGRAQGGRTLSPGGCRHPAGRLCDGSRRLLDQGPLAGRAD